MPFVQGTSNFKLFTVKEHEEDEGHGGKGEERGGRGSGELGINGTHPEL